MFNLDDYRTKKNEILNNDKLSQKGKDEALARLEQGSKDEARKAIKALRKKAVQSALALRDAQNERVAAAGQAVKELDYSRLNYEAQAVRSKILASENLSDVEVAFRDAKSSGDVYALKAWKDTSEGLIIERFGGEGDYSDFRGELLGDIKSAKIEVETGQKTQNEIDALNTLRETEAQAKEINEAFGQGQAVVTRVFDGIGFEGDTIHLGFDYETNKLTDNSETALEVALRLERESDQAFDYYQGEMTKKGYDSLDRDFDDLAGAL
jgi:hypothetical protein